MTAKKDQRLIPYNPISIAGKDIGFANKAEHVGVIRSGDGNLPNLLSRFTAHRRALAALLFAGVARNHRGNISAALKSRGYIGPGGATRPAWSLHQLCNQAGLVAPPAR